MLTKHDYLLIHNAFNKEDSSQFTCRPAIKKNAKQAEKQFNDFAKKGNTLFLGIYTHDKTPMGRITLFDYNPRNNSLEIGYFMLPEFRQKGVAKAAVHYLVYWLLKQHYNKIYAQTASFNTASIRLLQSVGFKQDACLRQHHEWKGKLYDDYIFSILKEDII